MAVLATATGEILQLQYEAAKLSADGRTSRHPVGK